MIKEFYDIIIVGAGPAGTTAARYAAQKGLSVLVLEKDRDVGYPVRCGEAVSHDGLLQFIEPDKNLLHRLVANFVSFLQMEIFLQFQSKEKDMFWSEEFSITNLQKLQLIVARKSSQKRMCMIY